jgi:hypothetical protein
MPPNWSIDTDAQVPPLASLAPDLCAGHFQRYPSSATQRVRRLPRIRQCRRILHAHRRRDARFHSLRS